LSIDTVIVASEITVAGIADDISEATDFLPIETIQDSISDRKH